MTANITESLSSDLGGTSECHFPLSETVKKKKKTRIIKLNPYLCLLELSGCYMVAKLSQTQMSHLLCWAVCQNHWSRTEQCEKILSSTAWGHSTDSTVDASTKLVTCLDQLL